MFYLFLIILPFLVSGWLLSQHLIQPTRLCDLPLYVLTISFGLFYGLTTCVAFLTGVIYVSLVVSIGLVSLIASLYFYSQNKVPAFSFKKIKSTICSFSKFEWIAWGIITIILGILLIIGSVLPYRIWDAVGYHAYNPITWSFTNEFKMDTFADTPADEYRAAGEVYTNIKSILTFLILEIRGNTTGTGITQWPFLILLSSSIFSLIRRLNISRWLAPVACSFALFIPEAMLQSLEIYSDVALYGSLICLVGLLHIIWQDGFSWGRSILCAIGFVLLTGTKPVGLPLSVGIGITYLLFIWLRSVGSFKIKVRNVALSLIVVLLFCAFTSGAWAWHGWKTYQNPVYPVHVEIAGNSIFEGPSGSDTASRWAEKYIERSGVSAWWWIVGEHRRETALSSWHNGTGSAFFILGIPSIIIFILYGIILNGERKELWPIVHLGIISLLFTPTLIVPRFILFQVAFSAIAFCWLIDRFSKKFQCVFIGLLFFCILSNFLRVIPSILYRPKPADIISYALITGHSDWLPWEGFPSDYHPGDYWKDTAESGDKLGVIGDYYTLYLPTNREAGMMVLLPPESNEFSKAETIEWLIDHKEYQLTHLITKAPSPMFNSMISNSDLFDLIIRRRDSARKDPRGFSIPDESVLVKIKWENVK